MPWLQLNIITNRDAATTIEAALGKTSAVSITFQDNADQPILEPGLGETPLWDSTKVTALYDAGVNTKAITQQLGEQLGDIFQQHQWEQLEDKDWEREWMQNYQPIQCGEKLWICPSWLTPPDPAATNLMLDPGLAFGTGTHPTTFLCMQWLAEQDFSGKRVVDYGCGSGILAITTLLLGAESAIGVDIDPQALLATRDNAQRNQVPSAKIPVYLPKACPKEPADIVVANILAGPLAELAPTLSALTVPGGKLCLSGILASQAEIVMQAYTAEFDFDPIVEEENWVRLTATKHTEV